MTTGGTVDVRPETVVLVFNRLREASRTAAEVAGAVARDTPLMPPVFFWAVHSLIEQLEADLRLLALGLEVAVIGGSGRLGLLETAAGGRVAPDPRAIAGDALQEARGTWDNLVAERGLDLVFDRPASAVHAGLGAADNVLSTSHTAMVLGLGILPLPAFTPGRHQARQELIAMTLNLCRVGPLWALLEPRDHEEAARETLARIVDWKDLQDGDLPRWGGHMAASVLMGKGVGRLGGGALEGGAVEGVAVEGGLSWQAGTRAAYQGVSQANNIPPTGGAHPRSRAGTALLRAQQEAAAIVDRLLP